MNAVNMKMKVTAWVAVTITSLMFLNMISVAQASLEFPEMSSVQAVDMPTEQEDSNFFESVQKDQEEAREKFLNRQQEADEFFKSVQKEQEASSEEFMKKRREFDKSSKKHQKFMLGMTSWMRTMMTQMETMLSYIPGGSLVKKMISPGLRVLDLMDDTISSVPGAP